MHLGNPLSERKVKGLGERHTDGRWESFFTEAGMVMEEAQLSVLWMTKACGVIIELLPTEHLL